jgi:pimeloyl-ACP methyl ester carboxylesterase
LDGSGPEQYWRAVTKRFGMDFDAVPAEDRNRWLAMDCRALVAAQQDRASQEALLPGINTRCLMYAGDTDGLYAQAQQAAKAMSNCAFVTVPAGHVPAFQNASAILERVQPGIGIGGIGGGIGVRHQFLTEQRQMRVIVFQRTGCKQKRRS